MTRTFFIRPDSASSDCALTTDSNIDDQVLNAQTAGNETNSHDIPQGSNINNYVAMSFVMPSGEIGEEDLPASSLFTVGLDVTVIGGNVSVRIEVHAYDSGCTSLGSQAQAEGDVTSTGVATLTATWDPPAAADRYGIQVMAGHGGMHSDAAETLTIRGNNANAIFDFPDAPVSADPANEWLASRPNQMNVRRSRRAVNFKEMLVAAGWFPPGG